MSWPHEHLLSDWVDDLHQGNVDPRILFIIHPFCIMSHLSSRINISSTLSLSRRGRSPVLPLVVSIHLDLIPSPLPPLPETASALLDQGTMTERTVFWPVIPLPTTPTTDHAVRPLVRVLLRLVMALITRVDLLAAAEPEPPVTLRVVTTTTTVRQLGARCDAKLLSLSARSRCGR